MFPKKLLYVLAAASVFQGIASAHTMSFIASSTCGDSGAVINYTTSSDGYGATVDIRLNGVSVDTAVLTPANAFTQVGQKPAPAGNPVTATAVVTAWTDQQYQPGQTVSVSVPVPTDCLTTANGRFTGGGKQNVDDVIVLGAALSGDPDPASDGKGGSPHVTKGFEIHCDLATHNPNTLEVNWTGGNHFHTETWLSATCTDDPSIKQPPPKAPVDTIVAVATGRYNGVSGFTIELTLVDAGEPGKDDKSGFKIYETANPSNIVLLVPLSYVTTGNIQAHYDNK